MARKRLISIDFDGVLHAFDGVWRGPAHIGDPVPGSIAWLYDLLRVDRYETAIFSSRNDTAEGRYAMREWLRDELDKEEQQRDDIGTHPFGDCWGDTVYSHIQWPTEKPRSFLHIDDRAWRFCGPGTLPHIDDLERLDAWWKPESPPQAVPCRDFLDILVGHRIYVKGAKGAGKGPHIFHTSDGETLHAQNRRGPYFPTVADLEKWSREKTSHLVSADGVNWRNALPAGGLWQLIAAKALQEAVGR